MSGNMNGNYGKEEVRNEENVRNKKRANQGQAR
jgi:hypothetical protein